MIGGRPVRVAFAGDAARFAAWAPRAATFVDTRGEEPSAVGAALRAARPQVVVALGVADHDAGALAAAGAPVLGVAVPAEEPPLWAMKAAAPGERPDRGSLAAAATAERARLWTPGSPGAACERIVALDPLDAAGGRLWRTIAPPVGDALFAAAGRARRPPRIVCTAPSTEHREWWLATAKHLHDVRHVAHGITPERLPEHLDRIDVALVAHPIGRPTFDHRVALHLAAGHLVIAEPLGRRHGLEPGLDLLEAADPDELARLLGALRRSPDLFRRVRIRGRLKAERFRASHVWGRVLHDLLIELSG